MRKLLFALLLMVAAPAMVTLNAQSNYASSKGGGIKISASDVPKAVKKSFHQSFPTAKQVEWEYTAQYYGGDIYTASFNMNGQKWEADFNVNGTLLSSRPKS